MSKKEKEIMENFEEQLEKKKKLPEDVQKKINKRIFENLLISIGIMFFNILLIFGFYNIERSVYLKDLKVFSMTLCVLTILIWETAYKKESGKICIWGIETAVVALTTLFCTYVCILQETKYILYLALASYIFAIYYLIKNIKIYKKIKRDYIKSLSDINEIIKKAEPEKKLETSRKRR